MVRFTKIYSLRFKHFIALFAIGWALFIVIWTIGAIAITKSNVIVDDNYKGKYIKVKHYKAYNKDSIYEYYYKPKEITVEIIGRHKSHIHFLRGEELTAHGDRDKIRNLKEGQKIKVIEYFYPSHEFKIK